MAVEVTIVVPHYRDLHLEETVSRLLAQEPGFEFEVVVVDDASPPEHMARVLRMEKNLDDARLKVLANEYNVGCGASRNLAVRWTESPVVAFCDSDLDPHPEWIRNGRELVRPGLIVTGPVPKRHRNGNPSLAERYNAIESPHHAGLNTFGTGNVFMMREDFRCVGMFNEAITRGHDMDLLSRWSGQVKVAEGLLATHPSKTHREKIQTIREIVKDWKRLGHRPSFVRRLAPDRNLLRRVMEADVSGWEKQRMLAYHFYLKGVYALYWVRS